MAYNSGNPNGQTTMANSAPVVIASNQSALNVQQNDISASGVLSANATYVTTAQLTGVSTASIQVTGTFVGTLTPQVSNDFSNYVSLSTTSLINVNTGAYSGTVTSTGMWQADIAGFNYFRLGFTAYTSGSATITIKTTNATGAIAIDNPLPAGSNTIGAVTGTVTSTMTASTNIIGVNPTVSTTGLTIFSNLALTNTVTAVKASAARMHEYDFYNPNASGVWVQLFNLATGSVTLGTTAPTRAIYLPATSGRDWTSPYSAGWSTALSIAVTTTANGSTAPGSAIQAYIGYV